MGHYKKKQYKKKSMDPWLQKNITYEIQEALEDYILLDDPLDIIEEKLPETTMVEKPSIIKELREEELQGLLPTWMLDPTDNSWLDTFLIDLEIHTKQQNMAIRPILDYEKTYQRAKKIADLLY
jgi:hypothetical protein